MIKKCASLIFPTQFEFDTDLFEMWRVQSSMLANLDTSGVRIDAVKKERLQFQKPPILTRLTLKYGAGYFSHYLNAVQLTRKYKRVK